MSIIAWDGHVLAADRQSSVGDTRLPIRKLWKLENGDALATTGSHDYSLVLKQWYIDGCDPNKWPKRIDEKDFVVMIIATKKKVFFYEKYPYPIDIEGRFCAWGIGREAALGALAMGASSVLAVKIASKYVSGCGFGVDLVRVK